MVKHQDGRINKLAPEGPGSAGWFEFQAERRGQVTDQSSGSVKRTTTGDVSNGVKRSVYRIEQSDSGVDDDQTRSTSVTTGVATAKDKAGFPSGVTPDFVLTVNYSDTSDRSGNSEFNLRIGLNGDAARAESLHDALFSSIISGRPYEAFRTFIQKHSLPYIDLEAK